MFYENHYFTFYKSLRIILIFPAMLKRVDNYSIVFTMTLQRVDNYSTVFTIALQRIEKTVIYIALTVTFLSSDHIVIVNVFADFYRLSVIVLGLLV